MKRGIKMTDLISRRAAIDALGDAHFKNYGNAIIVIQDLPSAEPVRHGKWIPLYNGEYKGGAYWFECSECKAVVTGGLQSGNRFCKGCGARMDK